MMLVTFPCSLLLSPVSRLWSLVAIGGSGDVAMAAAVATVGSGGNVAIAVETVGGGSGCTLAGGAIIAVAIAAGAAVIDGGGHICGDVVMHRGVDGNGGDVAMCRGSWCWWCGLTRSLFNNK